MKQLLRAVYSTYLYVKFRWQLRSDKPLKLLIGSGDTQYPGWTATEVTFLNALDQANWEKYFQANSIQAMLAEHVWEHFTQEQGELAAKLCYQFLQHGGHIRIAVPDGLFPNPDYIAHVKPGGLDPDAADHKMLYTYKTLSQVFERAGFKVNYLEYFDEGGQFHHQDWDPADGMIQRSKRFDLRNREGLQYTSLLIDAVK